MAIIYTDGTGKKTVFKYLLYHPIYVNGARKTKVLAPDGGTVYPEERSYKYWTKIHGHVDESWMVPSDCPLMFDSYECNMVGDFTLEIASFCPLIFEDVTTPYLEMIPKVNAREVEGKYDYYSYTNVMSRIAFAGAPSVAHKRVLYPYVNTAGLIYGRITLSSPNVVSQFGTIKRVMGYSGYFESYMADNHEYALLSYDGSSLEYPGVERNDFVATRDGINYRWGQSSDLQQYAHAVCADGLRAIKMTADRTVSDIIDTDHFYVMESWFDPLPPRRRYVDNGHAYGSGEHMVPVMTHNINTRVFGDIDDARYCTFDACLVNLNRNQFWFSDSRHIHHIRIYDTHLAIPVTDVVDSNYDIDEVSAIWASEGRTMSRRLQARLTSVYSDGIPEWGENVVQESRLTYPSETIVPL